MPDEPKEAPDPKSEPEPKPEPKEQSEEVGEFINRHILEKDTVFFEG